MPINRRRYDCKVAGLTVTWEFHFEVVSGVGDERATHLEEIRRECSNEIKCSLRGLLDRCPLRAEFE